MPGFDKTGPQGAGPMTGGGRGACRQNDQSGAGMGGGCGQGRGRCAGNGGGRGLGRGKGMGQGLGQGRRQQPTEPKSQVTEQQERDEK